MLSDNDIIKKFFDKNYLKDIFNVYKVFKADYFNPKNIKIPMGADGISLETFDKEIDIRCQIISNRLIKGTYQFYPLREVEVKKSNGGSRTLSIASIRDIIAQKAIYEAIYDEIEIDFKKTNDISFAYRKNKSAPQAVLKIYNSIQSGYTWILDADIVKFFDKIPHDNLIKIVEKKFGEDALCTKLIKRYIRTHRIPRKNYKNIHQFHHIKGHVNNQKIPRSNLGIPQGGVLSGILANLYLHSFDCWILDNLSKKYDLQYVRYADDFVVLTKSENTCKEIYQEIKKQLNLLSLDLHEFTPDNLSKTKILNLQETYLEFVGFEITKDKIRIKSSNIEKFKERIFEKIYGSSSKNIKSEKDYRSGRIPIRRFKFFIQKLNQKIRGRTSVCRQCNKTIKNEEDNYSERNWLSFFSIVTDTQQLKNLDKWIRNEIVKYFYKVYRLRLKRKHFRAAKLLSLELEYHRIRQQKYCKCVNSTN